MPLPSLSQDVLEYKNWNQDVVLERSKMISKIGMEVWSAKSTTMKGKAKAVKKPRRKRKATSKRKVSKRGK